MNINNVTRGFIPELYDASVLRTLENNLVMRKICTAKIKSPIKEFGDTVYFNTLGEATITDYTGTITHEALQDSQIAMLIDKTKTFAFKVEDADALMTNLDTKGSQSQRAAYNLKNAIELDFFQNVGANANAGTAVTATVTSANVLSNIALLAQRLYDNNVTDDNMWMVIPPWMRIKLQLAGIQFEINEGIAGKGGMQWTKDLGFEVYVTNTVYNSGTADAPVSTILAGTYQSIGFADRQLKTRSIELPTTRAIGIDGGVIYGYKVIKPKELAKATFTYAAESTI
jgi:hypothetical protein